MTYNQEMFELLRKYSYTLKKESLSRNEFDANLYHAAVEINAGLKPQLNQDEVAQMVQKVGNWTWEKLILPKSVPVAELQAAKEERIIMFLKDERVSYRKIGAVLDLTPAQVSTRVQRVRKRAKRMMSGKVEA